MPTDTKRRFPTLPRPSPMKNKTTTKICMKQTLLTLLRVMKQGDTAQGVKQGDLI